MKKRTIFLPVSYTHLGQTEVVGDTVLNAFQKVSLIQSFFRTLFIGNEAPAGQQFQFLTFSSQTVNGSIHHTGIDHIEPEQRQCAERHAPDGQLLTCLLYTSILIFSLAASVR